MPRCHLLWIVAVLLSAGVQVRAQAYTNLWDFESCLYNGPSSGSTCELAESPTPYQVPYCNPSDMSSCFDSLIIGVSNITITGSVVAGPTDTVIQRGSSTSMINNLLTAQSGVTNVTIENLTFDGNRYGATLSGASINCYAGGQADYTDVEINNGGTFTIQWDDFINAPGQALQMGGSSTVSYSNFGQGGYGVGPGGGSPTSETAADTATRFTAAWIYGTGNGAWYNAIAFAGTAAIHLDGSYQYAYGNLLQENRYEMSDGGGGGQLFVDPSATNASVAANVINGNYWPLTNYNYPYTPVATGCSIPSDTGNSSVEAYGYGHGFYNNEMEQNSEYGITFGGSSPSGQITISSTNPWSDSDAPRYIENNTDTGIYLLGPPTWTYSAQGATFNDVLVRNNGGYSVYLSEVQEYTGYTGFENGSCMSGNTQGNVPYNIAAPTNPLSYPAPASYSDYQGMSCPTSGSQTPGASTEYPTWPW